MDFAYYNTLLGKRESRKVANNTYAQRRDGGDIAIRLHATDVVTFHNNGTVTYRTGGYATVTTKDRLNNFGQHNVKVYSDKGEWMLYQTSPAGLAVVSPFVDGMTFDPDDLAGSTAQYRTLADDAHIANLRMKKLIDATVRTLTDERLSELVEGARRPMGLLGDCLICRVELSELQKHGRNYRGWGCQNGAASGDLPNADHLALHVEPEEQYVHATLLLCALTWAGYREPGYVLAHGDIVRRALKQYLKARLVTQASALVTATR